MVCVLHFTGFLLLGTVRYLFRFFLPACASAGRRSAINSAFTPLEQPGLYIPLLRLRSLLRSVSPIKFLHLLPAARLGSAVSRRAFVSAHNVSRRHRFTTVTCTVSAVRYRTVLWVAPLPAVSCLLRRSACLP